MGLSMKIEAYTDVRLVADAVLRNGGGQYVLPTPKQAVRWRARFYHFRNLAGDNGERQYNHLAIRLVESACVFYEEEIEGKFYDPEGNKIDLFESSSSYDNEPIV